MDKILVFKVSVAISMPDLGLVFTEKLDIPEPSTRKSGHARSLPSVSQLSAAGISRPTWPWFAPPSAHLFLVEVPKGKPEVHNGFFSIVGVTLVYAWTAYIL